MDTSDKNIDHKILEDEHISEEWSATTSALNSLNTTSSNSFDNINTLKEYCANPSDTLNDKEDFMVLESTSTGINMSDSNANDTKYLSMRKPSAFQKKHKPYAHNVSHMFENILQDGNQTYCTNPSDTLKNKEDLMVHESMSTGVNILDSNADDTKYLSMRKFSAFQKKHESFTHNVSHMFENVLQDNSQLEVTQDSISLSHFQKRKRMLPSNYDNFEEIIKSDNSGMDSTISTKSPKLRFSKKNYQSYFDVPDYNLTASDDPSVTDGNVSKKIENDVFKIPSRLVNDCSTTESFTNELTSKSTVVINSVSDNITNNSHTTSDSAPDNITKGLRTTYNSVSDNITNSLCTISDSVLSDKMSSLSNTSAMLNTNQMSLCSTMEMPSLNHTYDIPVNVNSTKIISENANNNMELKRVSIVQPINETYTLENDPTSNISTYNTSKSSENVKNIFSDTYTIENNLNESRPKSCNETTYTITDASIFYNQSRSSLQKPNFIRKIPLNVDSQDYNITVNDSNNTIINDEIDKMENNKSTKFKLNKKSYEGDSEIFENIIISSQENDISSSQKSNKDVISSTMNTSIGTSNNNLFNITSESKSKQNMEESIDKSLTQPSSILRDGVFEIDNISEIPLVNKFNKSNSFNRSSYKFNFSKKFGRLSKSYQENNTSFDREKNNINKLPSHINVDFDSNSQISNIQEENRPDSEIVQQLGVSSPSPIMNTISCEIENNSHDLMPTQNTTFTLSQSPVPHFTDKHNVNAHSEVFSNLIDHSVNSDTSANISKLVKFKNHKNVSETNSFMFENIITNSQTPNTSLTQKLTTSHLVLYNQSKIHGDEISIFVNMDDVLSNDESLENSDLLKKKITNEKDSKAVSINRKNTFNEQTNSLASKESINSLPNITVGLLENDSLSSGNHTNTSISGDTLNHLSNTSRHSISITSIEKELLSEIDGCQRNQSKRSMSSRCSTSFASSNDSITSNTIESLENIESPRNRAKRYRRSMSLTSTNEGLSLSNTTIRSLDSNRSSINKSKNSTLKPSNITTKVSSNISGNKLMQEDNTMSVSRISTRSSKNNSHSFVDAKTETLYNTNKLLNNEAEILNNTAESLKQEESTKKAISEPLPIITKDLSSISGNKLMQEDNTMNVSRMSTRSSKNKSHSFDDSRPETSCNTDKLLNNKAEILNNTAESLKQEESTKKAISEPLPIITKDLSSISGNKLMQEDNTMNVSRMSTRSSKNKSYSFDDSGPETCNTGKLLNNEAEILINTAESLKQEESTKKSISEPLPIITKDLSSIPGNKLMQEDNNTMNVSRMSTRSSKNKSYSFDDSGPETCNTDKLLNNKGEILNNTAESLKQEESTKKAISEPLPIITKDLSSISDNKLMQEDNNTMNVSRMSTRSSKNKSYSFDDSGPETCNTDKLLNNEAEILNNTAVSVEQKKMSTKRSISNPLSNISGNKITQEDNTIDNCDVKSKMYDNTDDLHDKNKCINTRVTRSKSSLKKTLKHNEVILSKVNANRVSTRSSKSLNNSSNNISDDSVFWTTLSDNFTSKSTTHSVCENEFQSPMNNELDIVEHIDNQISLMSINKQKATHPCAFELIDRVSRPLTRSFVRHTDGSPSILTRLLAGANDTSESTTYLNKSLSEIINDQSQIEDDVKVKFKSLYNKEPWITKALYNFLVSKLTPKYNIYSIKYAEKFVKYLASILKQIHTTKVDRQLYTDMLRYNMARYGIINDTFDYLGFLTDYIPKPYYNELIPGWHLATSQVKFDPNKYFVPIMKDKEFLNKILENVNASQ